jgi:hypothetical protein
VAVVAALLSVAAVVGALMTFASGNGVGRNPPLSDEAKAAMKRFLEEQ